jgi:hypothetical protein
MNSATFDAEATMATAVLEAARAAIQSSPQGIAASYWQPAGVKNQPLLPLLHGLICATSATAAAIADNAWDESLPIPAAGARGLAEALHKIADTITAAAAAPDATGWSLPSCTGKELV